MSEGEQLTSKEWRMNEIQELAMQSAEEDGGDEEYYNDFEASDDEFNGIGM